jgi:hypothetical protein
MEIKDAPTRKRTLLETPTEAPKEFKCQKLLFNGTKCQFLPNDCCQSLCFSSSDICITMNESVAIFEMSDRAKSMLNNLVDEVLRSYSRHPLTILNPFYNMRTIFIRISSQCLYTGKVNGRYYDIAKEERPPVHKHFAGTLTATVKGFCINGIRVTPIIVITQLIEEDDN